MRSCLAASCRAPALVLHAWRTPTARWWLPTAGLGGQKPLLPRAAGAALWRTLLGVAEGAQVAVVAHQVVHAQQLALRRHHQGSRASLASL